MQRVLYFKGNGEQKVLRQAGFELFTSISLSGRSAITLHWIIRMYVNGRQLSYTCTDSYLTEGLKLAQLVDADSVFMIHTIIWSKMAFSQLFLLQSCECEYTRRNKFDTFE